MSPHAHPHGLLRMSMLIVSTLAVVGVMFAIYIQYAHPPEERHAGTIPVSRPPVVPPSDATARPRGAAAMQIEGVPIHHGGRIRLNVYGPEGDRPRAEVEVDSFKPVGTTGREFLLEKPSVRFRTPAGQLMNLTADRGLIENAGQRGDKLDVARGRFDGHVVMLMDRLDETQRSRLPPEARDELTDERKICVELDDLAFDLEYARVESSGRIHAALAEAEFEGRHLMLRYDEVASRIEYLKIFEGERIALRGVGKAFAITLPGAGDAATADVEAPDAEVADQAPPTTSITSDEAADRQPPGEDDVPWFEPEPPEQPRIRETVTYTATFDDEVAVDQFQGQTQTGVLTADRLKFLFDFGQQQRDLAGRPPSSPPENPIPSMGAAGGTTAHGDESWVVLNWKGPLVVNLIRDPGAVPEDLFGKRLQVTATGREVHLADRQGSARCRKLEYHRETEQVRLYGDAEFACTLDIDTGGHLSGRELAYDPRSQTASVLGPGELVLADRHRGGMIGGPGRGLGGRGRDASIAFGKELNLCLSTFTREDIDPITGNLVIRQRNYVESAELLGDVIMAQDEDSIAADRVEIGFRPPAEGDSLADAVEELAEGGVRMMQGDERITCDRIAVSLARDANGRLVPVRADALGDVVAAQGHRAITATERMIVDLQTVEVEKPPFDPVQAKVAALRRGLNVDEVDWDLQRQKYQREKKLALGLRRLQAFGTVNAEDPERNLRIDAGRLECSFSDGRRIDDGVVSGRGTLPASIAFGDFGIMGREIEFGAATEFAEVPGSGRLTFHSRRDLDGRELAQPIPVSVTWTDSMSFRGSENAAVFTGAVHARSENNTFDCRELVLDFEEDRNRASARTSSPDPWEWWVLRPFSTSRRREERLRLEAPRIEKRLAYLSADGDVIGLTATYHEDTGALKTRARIAGPRLAVDLNDRTQAMTIDDGGTLLIEDYRLRPRDESGKVTKLSPFGAEGENLPSQTFVSWQGAMFFYSGSRLAVFEKDVELVYRSGSQLLLAEGVLHDAALSRLRESADGRDARLMCEQLNVQFLKKQDRDESPPAAGMTGLSGNEVASFSASGGVYFEDSDVSVSCRTITFDRERNLLQILGTPQHPAELIDQRHGQYRATTGPTFHWERDTGRIEAPRSTVRIH